MVWNFIGVYIINRTLHGRLEIRNFSSSVEKYMLNTYILFDFFSVSKLMNGQIFYYPGFKRIFFLLDIDGSRWSRVNEARSAER